MGNATAESSNCSPSYDRDAVVRLVGAVLTEQHDEWTEGRRYFARDILAKARATAAGTGQPELETAHNL